MRFDVITLFPELFAPFLTAGITRRAYASGQVDVHLWNPRDHAEGNYRRVDDRPFGGGPGMVMMAEPLERCLNHIRDQRGEALDTQAPLVLFSPIGRKLNHAEVEGWSASAGAILLCGRYEGVDQRFIDAHVTVQLSLGDFVLSGGEIAALALLDAADAYIERNGLDLPLEPAARTMLADPQCLSQPLLELDLAKAGVSTIIWATGFAVDYRWLQVDTFDEQGKPQQQRGVSREPGVYFVGLPWLSRRGSTFIWGVWHDAKYIADHIATQRKYAAYHDGSQR